MPVLVSFNGTNYNIPLTGELGWGDQVETFLVAVANAALVSGSSPAALNITTLNVTNQSFVKAPLTVAAGASITPTQTNIVLTSLSAIALSVTTAIANGTTEGQILILSNVGNYEIFIQNGANTLMNGDIYLATGESIEFKWDATLFWVEQRRSN
jgi:hypothetical protein